MIKGEPVGNPSASIVSRKEKALVTRSKPSRPETQPLLDQDHPSSCPTALESPDTFLQAIGVVGKDRDRQGFLEHKFWQVYGLLRVLLPAVAQRRDLRRPLHIVDAACGSSYLSFALYHYLRHVCDLPVSITGIDRNGDRIDKCVRMKEALGWEGLEFQRSSIQAFAPETPPEIVSLHGCDTATDEALARGIEWGSRYLFAVPCCQHELYPQLQGPALQALVQQGVLKDRYASMVTDALRVHALRIMGYRTDVVEFVSQKETPKNLLIRAEKGGKTGRVDHVRRYRELRSCWKDTPALERLLGEKLRVHVQRGSA